MRLAWDLNGEADFLTVEIGGRSIEGTVLGLVWWNPSFTLQELQDAHLKPFIDRGEGRGLRDPSDQIADDYSFEMDCSEEPDSNRNCDDGGGEELAWVRDGAVTIRLVGYADVDGERVEACSKELTVQVRRGGLEDPNEQPLDVFMGGNAATDRSHSDWHQTRDGLPIFPGEDWLFFHRALVRTYQEWRELFGYPDLQAWDGSTPIPTDELGLPMTDPTRPNQPVLECVYPGSATTGCVPPQWFSPTGNGTPRPEDPVGMQCHTSDGQILAGGQTSLADFPDADSLGCALNRTHHAAVHRTIPGSMRWSNESVQDPIFWRYHKWASGLSVGNAGALRAGETTAAVSSVWGAWEELKAEGAPGVSAVFPPRDRSLSTLTGVLVVFWEPVTGVVAGDLTVNGSPATQVEEEDSWYLFTGFDSPGDGTQLVGDPIDVTIELAPGAIADMGATAFVGYSWSYTISPDADGDAVPDDRDNCPGVANLDQRNSDSDLAHGYHAHGGEPPQYGSAGDAMGDACDDDDDNDGLSDAFEEQAGTDPTDASDPDGCPRDPRKHAPGACGCGVSDRDGDANGEPDCTPPLLATTTTTLPPAGDCGRPRGGNGLPVATDCLFLLNAAVGLAECIPECVCVLRGVYPTVATDALICLNAAVGVTVDLLCPCPEF